MDIDTNEVMEIINEVCIERNIRACQQTFCGGVVRNLPLIGTILNIFSPTSYIHNHAGASMGVMHHSYSADPIPVTEIIENLNARDKNKLKNEIAEVVENHKKSCNKISRSRLKREVENIIKNFIRNLGYTVY